MPKAPKRRYSQGTLEESAEKVRNKTMKLREAASQCNIPKSTLFSKVSNALLLKATYGPKAVLADSGKGIVDWILWCCDRGFPINKDQLLDAVQKHVCEAGLETPFSNGRPGRSWCDGFFRRHSELSRRMPQNLLKSRANVTEKNLREWLDTVGKYLEEKDLLNIEPKRKLNLDESAFPLVPKAGYVIARRSSETVHKVAEGDEKETLTVLFTINAEGTLAPPLVLFWYERLPKNVMQQMPVGWSVGKTERGWMTGESFYEYIAKFFYSWLEEENYEFPVIIFMDEHKSHITMPTVKFCREHQIELISLYPNATQIYQPFDVAIFSPTKRIWKSTVDNWRVATLPRQIKKDNFASVLDVAVQ